MQRQKPSISPRTPRRQEEPSPRPVMPASAGFPPLVPVQRGRVRTYMTPTRYRPAMKRARSVSSSEESDTESGNGSLDSHDSMESADERGLETDSEGDSSDGMIDTSKYSPPYEADPRKRIVVVSGPIRRPEPARSVGPAIMSAGPAASPVGPAASSVGPAAMSAGQAAMSAGPAAMSAGPVAMSAGTPGDPSVKPARLAARSAYAAANPAAKPAANPATKPAAKPRPIPTIRQVKRNLMTVMEQEALLRQELRFLPRNKFEKIKNIKLTPVRHHVNIYGRVDNQVYYEYAYTNHLSTPDNTFYFRYDSKNPSTREGPSSSKIQKVENSEAKVIVKNVENYEDFQLASKPDLVQEPEAKRAKEDE